MAMTPEEKKARRKARREAKKRGEKLPLLTKGASKKAKAAKGNQKRDESIKAWLKSVETDDYQNRGSRYPSSGKPDTIQTWGNNISAEFKNTSEREAKAWLERFVKQSGFKIKSINTEQTGDYRDDWVNASAEIS